MSNAAILLRNFANNLIDFIYKSPSTFHVIQNIEEILIKANFQELKLEDSWSEIKSGAKYYVTYNGSSLFAFSTGSGNPSENGIKMISAHSDSPGFKIKPSPEIAVEDKLLKLNTEVYGGPILASWFDRPLSVAGRVILKSDNPLRPQIRLVNIKKPLLIIPSLAIHLNRGVNDGVAISKQKDMLPLVGVIDNEFNHKGYLTQLIAEELEIDVNSIIDFDLTLYDFEKGCLVGKDNELISSPKLDDLAMVHAGLSALVNIDNQSFNMLCIFDNEEVGSGTKQGAGSPILKNILKRIAHVMNLTTDEYYQMIYKSFMVSADMAHSIHPNYTEKHDPVLHPVLNSGPVIKFSANQKYTSDADSGAVFEMICQKANVPYQKFVNNSDMKGGSTLGNISTGQLELRSVDIGNPMLSMHSIRELSGVKDHFYVMEAFKTFYEQ